MTTESKPSTKSKGCYVLVAGLIGLIAVLYLLQWVLEFAFSGSDTNELGKLLKPFNNHYLSLSKYYLTNEGSASEFTNDMTAVGRFIGFFIPGLLACGVILIPLALIKPLKERLHIVMISLLGLLIGVTFYSAFLSPPRKTIIGEDRIEFEKTNWLLFKTKGELDFRDIAKFEFDYSPLRDNEIGNALYAQLYVVAGGKRYLLGENQVPIERTDSLKLTHGQEIELQKAVDVLTEFVQKKGGINR